MVESSLAATEKTRGIEKWSKCVPSVYLRKISRMALATRCRRHANTTKTGRERVSADGKLPACRVIGCGWLASWKLAATF
jgi:hypothetical protein